MDLQDDASPSTEDKEKILLAISYLTKLIGVYFADKVKEAALTKNYAGNHVGARVWIIITNSAGVKQYTLRLGQRTEDDGDVPTIYILFSTEINKGSFWSILPSGGEMMETVSHFEAETLVGRLAAEPILKNGGLIRLDQLKDLSEGVPLQLHPRSEEPPADLIRRGSATAPPPDSTPFDSQEKMGRAAGLRSTRPDDQSKHADRFEAHVPTAEERETQLKLDKRAREKYRDIVLTEDEAEEDKKDEEKDATVDVGDLELPEEDTPRSHSPSPPLSTAMESSPPVTTAKEISSSLRARLVPRRPSSPPQDARTPPGSPPPSPDGASGMAPPPSSSSSTPLLPAGTSAAASPTPSRRRSHSSTADEEEPKAKIQRLEDELEHYKGMVLQLKKENKQLTDDWNAEAYPSLDEKWQKDVVECRDKLRDFVRAGTEPDLPIQLKYKTMDKDLSKIWRSLTTTLRFRRKLVFSIAEAAVPLLTDVKISKAFNEKHLTNVAAEANKIIDDFEAMEEAVNKFATDVIDERKNQFLGADDILSCEDSFNKTHGTFKKTASQHLKDTKGWHATTLGMF